MSYLTLSSQEKHLFALLSHASDSTTSLNIGGPMHGPSPTSNFGGTISPVPQGLRLCLCPAALNTRLIGNHRINVNPERICLYSIHVHVQLYMYTLKESHSNV